MCPFSLYFLFVFSILSSDCALPIASVRLCSAVFGLRIVSVHSRHVFDWTEPCLWLGEFTAYRRFGRIGHRSPAGSHYPSLFLILLPIVRELLVRRVDFMNCRVLE